MSGEDEDDSLPGIYEQQTMVALSIYSFMDNLFSAIRNDNDNQPDTTTPTTTTSADIKPGGYSEENFMYLSEKDKEEYECRICFNILKNIHQCKNNHKFCYGCILLWCKQTGENSDLCPVCRTQGLYAKNDALNDKLGNKRVKCLEKNCNWRGCLNQLDDHTHRKYDLKEIYSESELLPSIDKNNKVSSKQQLSDISPVAAAGRVSTSQMIQSYHDDSVTQTQPVADSQSSAANQQPTTNRILSRRESSTSMRLTNQTTSNRSNPATVPNSVRRSSITANVQDTSSTTTPRPPAGPRPRNVRPLRTRTGSSVNVNTGENNNESETTGANESTVTTTVNKPSSNEMTPEITNTTPILAPRPPARPLEFRRLVNRPRQAPNSMARRLHQSREQLAVLMTLLTIELDERRRAVEQYQLESQERERRRLRQLTEVQQLNNRLQQVASNIGRIVDGRQTNTDRNNRANQSPTRSGLGPPFGSELDSEDDDT